MHIMFTQMRSHTCRDVYSVCTYSLYYVYYFWYVYYAYYVYGDEITHTWRHSIDDTSCTRNFICCVVCLLYTSYLLLSDSEVGLKGFLNSYFTDEKKRAQIENTLSLNAFD